MVIGLGFFTIVFFMLPVKCLNLPENISFSISQLQFKILPAGKCHPGIMQISSGLAGLSALNVVVRVFSIYVVHNKLWSASFIFFCFFKYASYCFFVAGTHFPKSKYSISYPFAVSSSTVQETSGMLLVRLYPITCLISSNSFCIYSGRSSAGLFFHQANGMSLIISSRKRFPFFCWA